MKKSFLGLIIAGGLIISASTAIASGVCFANVQDIFETSPLGKPKVIAYQKQLEPEINKLKKTIQSLQNKINSYNENQNDIAYDDRIDKYQTENIEKIKDQEKEQAQKDLEKAMQQYQNLMNQIQQMASDDADQFKKALTKASGAVAKEKGFDTVLPTEISLYNINSLDVTKQIIDKMQN